MNPKDVEEKKSLEPQTPKSDIPSKTPHLSPLPSPFPPHKGARLDHALDVDAVPFRVRRPQVAHEVVAAVVDVARLRLGAAGDTALEGQTFRVRDALVALELLACREGDRAEVAWQLLVLANLVVPGRGERSV